MISPPGIDGGAPTWSTLYDRYLSVPSTGCVNNGCHHHDSSCPNASGCWAWLNAQPGGISVMVGGTGQLFTWDSDGWMPPNGPSTDPQAEADFAAWVVAGAQDN